MIGINNISMTSVKESSVIQENKANAFNNCPVTFVVALIGGYWKPIILFSLLTGRKRYSELKKSIPTITEKVLIQQLKQLEKEGLIIRKSKPVVPPYVTYELSKKGADLRPVLYEMAVWASKYGGAASRAFKKKLANFPG